MNAGPDVERLLSDWLIDEAPVRAPDRILVTASDRLDHTKQRRFRVAWRFPIMTTPVRVGMAAVIGVLLLGAGFYLFGGSGPGIGGAPPTASPTPTPAVTPEPSPPPLAVGNFKSHGGLIQLRATGNGPNVTGTMTYTDVGGAALGGFVVDLTCTRTTDGGLILLGGPITDATNGYVESAPEGSNIALVLQRGSPVKAEVWVEHPDPHEPSCPTFLAGIPDLGSPDRDPNALEPIDGTIELRP